MTKLFLRRLVSAAVAALGMVGAWALLALPNAFPSAAPTEAAPAGQTRAAGFHRLLRAEVASSGPGPCVGCHGAAPHRRAPATRAFLNLHSRALACGVCHLEGRDLSVRRHPETPGTLTAAQRSGAGWLYFDGPGPSIHLRPRGPSCTECHRRGSPLFADGELFDPYRRRLLEDLAVLRYLGGAAR